jgi:uncharacterized protein (TIGR03118 family)
MRRVSLSLLGVFCVIAMRPLIARAQANSYKQTNLVSDTAGMAPNVDPNLVNPWGIAFFPNQPFWISDNASPIGVTTLYDQTGKLQGTFTIPPPHGSSNPATPTGIVANLSGQGFLVNGQPSSFIFDTEDGTISGWNGAPTATLVVDNSKVPSAATGAVYKGLALITNKIGAFLLAANFRSGKVEVYDSNFNTAHLSGDFTDPNPPAIPTGAMSPGWAPFGIHVINGQVVVTYALQDQPQHDPIHMAGAGVVDLFDVNGNLVRRIATGGNLNAPWGTVMAPAGFGAFGGKLLVGNFGDGTINAFDFTAGTFVDQMKDATGAVITNASLWDMVFGGGGPSGDPNTMYITAGLANEMHGLFSALTANATPTPPGADFSVNVTPATQTIAAGQTVSFMVTIGGLSGFNSTVTLSCSGQPLGSNCNFSPTMVTPQSGSTATSTMTIGTSSAPYHMAALTNITGDHTFAMLLTLPALGFLAVVLAAALKVAWLPNGRRWNLAGGIALLLIAGFMAFAMGCGGGGSNNTMNGTQRGTATIVVTGASGSITHSANVTLTVQ